MFEFIDPYGSIYLVNWTVSVLRQTPNLIFHLFSSMAGMENFANFVGF